MNFGTRFNNYILAIISVAAMAGFFAGYRAQDPRHAAQVSFTKKAIRAKAINKLTELGYEKHNFTVSGVHFQKHKKLLDSLQHQMGRHNFIKWSKQNSASNIKPFYWQIGLKPKKSSTSSTGEENITHRNSSEKLQLLFDTRGKFIALINSYNTFPKEKVQHSALHAVIQADSDSARQSIFSKATDSTLSRLLIFDLQRKHGNYADYQPVQASRILRHFKYGFPYLYSVNDARALADFYLSKTGWHTQSFRFDTAFVQRIGGMNDANVRYLSTDRGTGQQLQLDVTVAPTGALMHMNARYYPEQESEESSGFVWGIARAVLIFILVLTGIILFFFRIRSATIDTRSALVAALVTGWIFSITILLTHAGKINPFNGQSSFHEIILLFIQMGFGGAFLAVGYFMLFSIGDSITRQHWPQKLTIYDYLRRGSFLNKPLGRAILRAVALSLVLCGFWTMLLYIFPHAWLSTPTVFLNEQAVWSPLLLLLANSWFSFGIILAAFLTIGSLVYGQTENRWVSALAAAVVCGILAPVTMHIGPPAVEFVIGVLIGGALAFIYIQWDFLTVLIAFFLFLGFLSSAAGWLTPHSPDQYIFIIFLIFTGILLLIGSAAVYAGVEERLLPEYVPGYVEELAQEQRIKQELQIARDVHQSFLPSAIPAIAGLDIAAVCKPASETGGDYYDFIPLDDHRVAVAVGDVSGKGIQAAFYMTLVKGMLHSLCRETDSPAKVLQKANRLFYDNAPKGTFVSLIYGIIDLQAATFTFARAGHNPVLHFQSSSGAVRELRPDGLGMGLTKGKIFDNKISEIKLSITEDDLFLLYTDGIVEALNQAHQFYGMDNLIKLVKRQNCNSASEIISVVSEEVSRFISQARQHDDMTLMAIRFRMNEC